MKKKPADTKKTNPGAVEPRQEPDDTPGEDIVAAVLHEDNLDSPEEIQPLATAEPLMDASGAMKDEMTTSPPTLISGSSEVVSVEDAGSRREKVGKATLAITAANLVGRLMGFGESWAIAGLFGTSNTAGAYVAASNIPQNIFGLGDQLLTHSLLPVFVDLRNKKGEGNAWRLAGLVATIQLIILVLLVAIGLIFAPQIVHFITREFDPKTLTLTAHLTRLMLPAAILMSLTSLTYVILNAYKQFALPAFSGAALKAGVVLVGGVGCYFLHLGIETFAIGLILGSILKMALNLYGLRGKLKLFHWNLDLKQPAAAKLVALMIPLMLSNLLTPARNFLDTYFSGLPAEVAARKFAFSLTSLPFVLVPSALSIALFPFLADMASRGDRKNLGRALVSAMRMISFLLVPITAVYLVLAFPLVETVFKHGHFTSQDAVRVVGPFVWYSIGMIPLAAETVVLQIYFALADTVTPMNVAYGTFILYVVVAYVTTQFLGWGATGVAIAFTASKLLKDIILFWILGPRLGGLDLKGVGLFLGKLSLATGLMVLALAGTLKVSYHSSTTPPHPNTVSAADSGSQSAGKSGQAPVGSEAGANSGEKAPQPSNTVDGAAASSPVGGQTLSAATPPGGTAAQPKKKSKAKKFSAVKIFLACATPGLVVFVLASYWLRIEELMVIYGILIRRLGPISRKIALAAMAPW